MNNYILFKTNADQMKSHTYIQQNCIKKQSLKFWAVVKYKNIVHTEKSCSVVLPLEKQHRLHRFHRTDLPQINER